MAASKLFRHAALGAIAAFAAGCSQGVSESAPEERADAAPVETTAAADTASAAGSPALWTLADEDTTIHLFGTVHVLKPGTEWKSEAMEAAFNDADAVFFEADTTSNAAQAAAAQLIPQLGFYTDGRTLSGVLEEDDEREVVEALDIMGVPLSAYDGMQPWLAGMTMGVQFLITQGYSADSGVETVLAGDAESAGKPLRFFETMEEQLNFFATLPEDDQINFLVASAEGIENEPDQLDELVDEWVAGDVDALAEMLSDTDAFGSERVYDVLLTTRNEDWVEQIKTLLAEEEGVFFIAVGAAHLAGDDSVQAMLRADGIEVSGP